ncbi:hypothetical protein F7X37_00067 [Candidatus Ecksteinia adelgidicola]|nr:hypothetical protein F7X37_00067 [Candidatus Ecksteinia adelgidicola]
MRTLTFLFKNVIDLYIIALLLYVWMRWTCINFYNPLSQFVFQVSQPFINLTNRITSGIKGPFNGIILLLIFLLMTVKYFLLLLMQGRLASIGYYSLLFSIISLIKSVGYLIFWVITMRSVISWISSSQQPINYVLYQLTEPLTESIRKVIPIIPIISRIDVSSIVIILILYLLNYLGIDFLGRAWFLL